MNCHISLAMPRLELRDRAERLDLLTRLLSDRPGITATELARELDVSVRSIFRDLRSLRDRGLAVDASRGRGGGLRLPANWGLGRITLAREEALCALLALAIADRLAFPMFATDLARARRKIAAAFPAGERRKVAPLRERIFVGSPASVAVRSSYSVPPTPVMRRLQVAFVDERPIRAEYVKEGGELSVRRLDPHALVINWPAWYLVAYDHSRGSARTFRLDRFVGVDIESGSFAPRAAELVREVLQSAGVEVDRI